ncbi:MAG: ribosomal RNA small subunit methyltransferase A [Desulfobulbaceae bacterium A2]|nr:MAG: ribosomal RNA small subunit methyltransferase A [Desulfobulbaceae bacterium A2]
MHGSGLAPSKRRGQNFLVHQHTAERIAELAVPGPEAVVVEVGVGLGALTVPLARRARRVIGLEVDAGLIRWHEEKKILPDNVELRHQDILTADLAELAALCGGPLVIAANLPYNISSPFLFRLIEQHRFVQQATIMLQLELAQRLQARPGTKDYGVPTVLLATCATVTPLLSLGPDEFHPRPKVASQVVRLDFQPPPAGVAALPPHDPATLKRLVHAAFQQRRKTLRNSLRGLLSAEQADKVLATVGQPPSIRAETLDLAAFAALAGALDALAKGRDHA